MEPEHIKDLVITSLEDMKASEIITLDVRGLTSITDFMVVCSGTSQRHIKSIADKLIDYAKQHKVRPLGMSGEQTCEWVLVDLADVIVHVMLPESRELYQLEALWRSR